MVYTVEEVAEILKFSRAHIYNLIDAGLLDASNFGSKSRRSIRISHEALERAIRSGVGDACQPKPPKPKKAKGGVYKSIMGLDR